MIGPSTKRRSFRGSRRQPIRSEELPFQLAVLDATEAARPFVLVAEPSFGDLDLTVWAAENREAVESRLRTYGAILFRGFGMASPEEFHRLAQALCGELLDYKERAAPRHEVGSNLYTSTEFPADQVIPLHHEMSYSHNWPKKLLFYCDQPPAEGGRTPVVDDRRFIEHIDPEVKERLVRKGVRYVRNYGEGIDLPWQEVFQTSDRGAVEEYCRGAGMEVEWLGGDRLRTWASRQVVVSHPETGDPVWFNHAHLFHSSNLDPEIREILVSEYGARGIPRNAFYGDGSEIPDEDMVHIRELYEDRAVRFTWEKGDVLLVDNFLATHGREPFQGPRRILVAMADLYTESEL